MALLLMFCYIFTYLVRNLNASSVNVPPSVFVVGSINADITFPLEKLPQVGETVVSKTDNYNTVAGGKGANQAVSCSRMGCPTYFSCNFGNDDHAKMLENILNENSVNLKYCYHSTYPSGLGLIFLQNSGSVSAIVIGGSNIAWPKHDVNAIMSELSERRIACIMLQMEIPQEINQLYAQVASSLGIPVFQDIGGEERELSDEYIQLLTYVSPNLTELERLTKMSVKSETEIINAAKSLQIRGAKNVLVTLGSEGSLLLTESGEIIKQGVAHVDKVVDETGAGDNYRAAFVVSHFVEKKSIKDSMAYAAVSGAISVTKKGAIPACTTREECELYMKKHMNVDPMSGQTSFTNIKGGYSNTNEIATTINNNSATSVSTTSTNISLTNLTINAASPPSYTDIFDSSKSTFPWKFASRLNSMKDRWDLVKPPLSSTSNVLSWIKRSGLVNGLDYIDFNYPQHLKNPVNTEERNTIVEALNQAKLSCGAICLRFPKEMQNGAFTNPNKILRDRAIQMTKEACEWALVLGASEVVVWSAFCGYDYSFQVDYDTIWNNEVTAFQSICDIFPTLKISLEYKPTDENTRFFAVESTGSAILLMKEINRSNFGLTIDFGHCLMAGENPAQSIASVARHSKGLPECKLYGIQLGDGYGRLGAEDGLAFGSIHPIAALEFVYQLVKMNYKGHIYFDTFPRNEDPVRECEYNIRQFKKMYYKIKNIVDNSKHYEKFKFLVENHDAMGMLEFLENFA